MHNGAEFLLVDVDTVGWQTDEAQRLALIEPGFDAFYFDTRLEQFAESERIAFMLSVCNRRLGRIGR